MLSKKDIIKLCDDIYPDYVSKVVERFPKCYVHGNNCMLHSEILMICACAKELNIERFYISSDNRGDVLLSLYLFFGDSKRYFISNSDFTHSARDFINNPDVVYGFYKSYLSRGYSVFEIIPYFKEYKSAIIECWLGSISIYIPLLYQFQNEEHIKFAVFRRTPKGDGNRTLLQRFNPIYSDIPELVNKYKHLDTDMWKSRTFDDRLRINRPYCVKKFDETGKCIKVIYKESYSETIALVQL